MNERGILLCLRVPVANLAWTPSDKSFNEFGVAASEKMGGASGRGSRGEIQSGLKSVMRLFPQGVTVVTTQAPDGPKGITVSSFTSVSLDPPLVLVSLAKGSNLHDTFVGANSFAVNLLGVDQESVSDHFAGRLGAGKRFGGIKFRSGPGGSPVIEGARGAIECKAWKVYDGGDHSIILGEVVSAFTMASGRPLVYYAQQYTTVENPKQAAPPSDIVR